MRNSLSLLIATLVGLAGITAGQAAKPVQPPPYTPVLDVASMDKHVDPCVDFFAYSCGGWIKNNPIPADQASWSAYGGTQWRS